MEDPHLTESTDPSKMPFDGKRMFWGGFETIIGALFSLMFRNVSSLAAFFKIPSNRVVELGSKAVSNSRPGGRRLALIWRERWSAP